MAILSTDPGVHEYLDRWACVWTMECWLCPQILWRGYPLTHGVDMGKGFVPWISNTYPVDRQDPQISNTMWLKYCCFDIPMHCPYNYCWYCSKCCCMVDLLLICSCSEILLILLLKCCYSVKMLRKWLNFVELFFHAEMLLCWRT
jgi:hypothetical protein